MLDRLTSSLLIGFSGHRITLHEQSGWRRPTLRLLAEQAWPEDDASMLIHRLRELLSSTPIANRSAAILLGDDLVRYFMVTPPANAARMADCRAAAAMRFQTLYGESSAVWELAADWDARSPFLACAIPTALRDGLLSLTSEQALHVTRMTPAFIAAWNRLRPRLAVDAWFGAVSGARLTIGVIHDRRLCAVRSASLPPQAWQDADWLPGHVLREALLFGLPLPHRLQLCGDLPADWTDRRHDSLAFERLDAARATPDAPKALAKPGADK